MTDADKCGAETTDGTPCENPAESCPWHDTDNPPATGRDFAIDESDHEDILDAARDGFSKAGCARAAGVGKSSFQRYLDAHDEFRNAFMRARHKGEKRLVTEPLYEPVDNGEPAQARDLQQMDGQHARFLLSTSFDYVKTERKEITGEDGGAVEVSSDVVTVTEVVDE